MPNLQTKYMGLSLNNPIIAGSSGLTKSLEKIQQCEEAGAGAVVLKSLFEEVLAEEDWGFGDAAASHPEAYDYMRAELKLQYGPNDYCDLISDAKKQVKIPLIASINCVSAKWWTDFAKKIEAAGADAIELNVFTTATDTDIDSPVLEKLYYDILEEVKSKVNIPVAMKIGMYFTALPSFVSQLGKRGLDALVLFNRFTEPDIDINKLELKTTFSFSSENEINRLLRWIAILSGKMGYNLSATGGIHNAEGIIKILLAGATTVQLTSALYREGVSKIKEMENYIRAWMTKHDFESIDQFRGMLNFANTANPELFLRTQFMEKIRGFE
jgi:dihydroorotate dehydrogenase (fumarate)